MKVPCRCNNGFETGCPQCIRIRYVWWECDSPGNSGAKRELRLQCSWVSFTEIGNRSHQEVVLDKLDITISESHRSNLDGASVPMKLSRLSGEGATPHENRDGSRRAFNYLVTERPFFLRIDSFPSIRIMCALWTGSELEHRDKPRCRTCEQHARHGYGDTSRRRTSGSAFGQRSSLSLARLDRANGNGWFAAFYVQKRLFSR